MFSNNLTLVEINDSTEFRNSNIFINKNDNEYYGYYMVLPNDCTVYYKIAFLKEVIKLLKKVRDTAEQEFYIEKISKRFGVSQEAIIEEVKKIL